MIPPVARMLVLLAIALVGVLGCAAQTPRAALAPDAVALFLDAERAGVSIEDPTIIDASTKRALDEQVGRGGTPTERVTRLRRWLHEGANAFHHDPTLTIDARSALRERRGGCMTHAILFVTLARHLGIEAYYVHALTAREFADRDDGLVAMTHVAIGFEDGGAEHVLDVWMPVDDWRLVRYKRIADSTALALYYSNLAVEDLRAGRLRRAERQLRFLAAKTPDVAEVWSNLVAVLVRARRYSDALAVVRQGLERFPLCKPLYTNGYLAAIGAGNEALANELVLKGRDVVEADPIFVFARGVQDYERGHYAEAARWFEQARAEKSDSVVIELWLVRAYVAAGDSQRGVAAFERARHLAPNDPRLERLVQQTPELRSTH